MLANKLDLSPHRKIHPVISVAQLKSTPLEDNLYDRTSKSDHPTSIAEINEDQHECTVEKLIDRCRRSSFFDSKMLQARISKHTKPGGQTVLPRTKKAIKISRTRMDCSKAKGEHHRQFKTDDSNGE